LELPCDVVRATVELSCSTTRGGDPRDPLPAEAEENLLELRFEKALVSGQPILLLEDTTPATTVTLPPGSYIFQVSNVTSRRRNNVTDSASFSFGAAAECHRLARALRASTVVRLARMREDRPHDRG
jgi:hypothetical protein